MYRRQFVLLIIFCIIIPLASPLFAQIEIDIETGVIFPGYNDVRIPGKGGTLFSLSDDLEADNEFFYRIRLFYDFNDYHHIGILFAPLSINSAGQLDRDLIFEGVNFPANTPLETTYQFNSYRLIYRYDFLRNEKIEAGIGFTAKIRDAKIAVEGDNLKSEKTNVGFVPIIHFRLFWKFSQKMGFLLDGDALAAPQGRAEDVLAALIMQISERTSIKLGYRILEGGADNDEVYNFTLINYASLGILIYL